MYSCVFHGWNSRDEMCPTCAALSTTTVASTTINPVSSPSGANVLVKELENIINNYDHDEDAHKYNNLPACRVCSATKALAQYNAVEPEKKRDDVMRRDTHRVMEELGGEGYWKTCSGCHESEDGHDVGHYPYSEIFKCKLGGGCHECGGIGAVWEYHPEESQSPQTPIPIEPEGIDGMGNDPL